MRDDEFWTRDGAKRGVLWTNLFGRRVSTGCTSRRHAEIWKRAQERTGADPRLAASERACLDDAIRDLYAELRRRGRSAATLKRARQKLGHFPRLWGAKRRLSTIDARLISEYIDTRLTERGVRKGATVSRLTIRDELAFLRQLLKLARRHKLYPYAIDDVMPLLFETGHKPRRDFIPFADLPRLLIHLPSHRRAHVTWFCVCGGRLADSIRARREDIDADAWRITVRGSKTAASYRTIPVPKFLRSLVSEVLQWAPGEDVLFLPWGKIDRDLKAACARARLPAVSSNGLRRTFGHALRTHGFDLDTISKMFGHTTAKLARDVYADTEGDELAAVVGLQEDRATYKKRTRTASAPRKPRQNRA